MKKWLIGCLFFLFVCLPMAEGAEEVVIRNTEANDIQTYLLAQAKEAGLIVKEKNDAFLILHMKIEDDFFAELWGKDSYLRCIYRFYPQGSDTLVTYETQAVNGVQISPFTAARLGDYHSDRLAFAHIRLATTAENLSKLRLHFEGLYMYGLILGTKADDVVQIAEILPLSPCQKAGLRVGDRIVRFAGIRVKDATDFDLFYHYAQHELAAKPLTLTLLRGGKETCITIMPQFYTEAELDNWERLLHTTLN